MSSTPRPSKRNMVQRRSSRLGARLKQPATSSASQPTLARAVPMTSGASAQTKILASWRAAQILLSHFQPSSNYTSGFAKTTTPAPSPTTWPTKNANMRRRSSSPAGVSSLLEQGTASKRRSSEIGPRNPLQALAAAGSCTRFEKATLETPPPSALYAPGGATTSLTALTPHSRAERTPRRHPRRFTGHPQE